MRHTRLNNRQYTPPTPTIVGIVSSVAAPDVCAVGGVVTGTKYVTFFVVLGSELGIDVSDAPASGNYYTNCGIPARVMKPFGNRNTY